MSSAGAEPPRAQRWLGLGAPFIVLVSAWAVALAVCLFALVARLVATL